ncbi:hypothetical protein ASG17_12910 [Brevundimonas sp. Leaf363]|uniref:hypothetical protein n=1 Tax=Brevundimonas sp. Leaf363 TaxID=1736353 RepID=UPI0006FE5AF5|nr:hypothetical protein [Brevundimonas sp. Leaf363]KQS53858.1 hypothetical protein ASG17_12910 [Brevundimonas sp. Leaf363]
MKALAMGLSLFAALAGPAWAQSPTSDWERSDVADDVTATIRFADAPTFSVTCSSGQLMVLVSSLPKAGQAARTRSIVIRQAERTLSMPWIAGASDEALAGAPRPLARALRRGGRLTVQSPGDADAIEYALDLPARSEAVTHVMERCGAPLEDPRDDLPPLDNAAMRWTREPEPSYPDRLTQNGLAVVSCITTRNGHLRDCVVEAEFPTGFELGRAALQAYRVANIGRRNGGEVADGQLMTAALRMPCQRCLQGPAAPR